MILVVYASARIGVIGRNYQLKSCIDLNFTGGNLQCAVFQSSNDAVVVKVRNITLHVQKNVTIRLGNNTLALEISSLQILEITTFNLGTS